MPRTAVGADLDVEVVVADETELGPPGSIALVELTRRIASRGLVDLLLVAGACVIEKVQRRRASAGSLRPQSH